MKICLLGDVSGNIDEGMKKITYKIAKELSKTQTVLVLNPLQIFSITFWRSIANFNPQIFHYIPGPSIKSLILVKIISLYFKDKKIIMSAPFPRFSNFSKKFIHLFKPDLILVQSEDSEKLFKEKKFKTKFFPLSGVEIERFIPVSNETKEALRDKYGINKTSFVVLHVGHIKKGRNIQIFKNIQNKKNNQVVIVGSTSTGVEISLYEDLKKNGCIVFTDYIENINEIYALSDCYIFLVIDKSNSVEMPLSILEAMSCNLPIIATKFGILTRIFKEGQGLFFIENVNNVNIILQKIKIEKMKIRTREIVSPYSWENIIGKLVRIYEK